MGQNLKVILQATIIVSIIVALIMWDIPAPVDAWIWVFRFAIPVVIIWCAIVLIRSLTRKEILPDLLRAEVGTYFEREGICFGFLPIAIGGISWMQIFFQNRCQKPCTARVVLQAPREYFLGNQKPLNGIDVDVECDGGAFGVCRVPWPIPRRLQGKKTKFQVAASVSYPSGRGKLLRFRNGMRVGTPGGGLVRAATSGGLLLVGVVRISWPASLTMVLPNGVGEESPPAASVYAEILFRPELTDRGSKQMKG